MSRPELRELSAVADLRELAAFFTAVWGAAQPLVDGDLLRAMSKAGSYITGAYLDGRLVGGALAFHEEPAARTLHSHLAAVLPEVAGTGVGVALKRHQRAWALARGITAIEWTYDPLVARNAHFNLAKLGARPVEYLVDFYGSMDDARNGADESDRILVRWDLRETPEAVEHRATDVRVALPADIEALRRVDPAAARRWRHAVREALAPRMAAGWRIAGYDRDEGYLLVPPPDEDSAAHND